MARECGSGSFPKARHRILYSAPSKLGIRTMLCTNRFSASVFLSLMVLLLTLSGPSIWAQNTDDDVHIKPRTAPKPEGTDRVADSAF